MQYRVPLSQPVSSALLDFSYEKKIHIDASQEDMGDKEVWHPEDEQQLAARPHPVPSLELPHPFAESVEVPTVSATTAEQELLLSPDSPHSSKVRKCLCVSWSVKLYR